MRHISVLLLLAFVATALPSSSEPGHAQTVKCYRKKCLEYPDGTKICEITPVDCDAIQIL